MAMNTTVFLSYKHSMSPTCNTQLKLYVYVLAMLFVYEFITAVLATAIPSVCPTITLVQCLKMAKIHQNLFHHDYHAHYDFFNTAESYLSGLTIWTTKYRISMHKIHDLLIFHQYGNDMKYRHSQLQQKTNNHTSDTTLTVVTQLQDFQDRLLTYISVFQPLL